VTGLPGPQAGPKTAVVSPSPDRVAELLLAACAESGALALFAMMSELKALADGAEFTTPEACAHATVPKNVRLRAAIEAVCGEIDARKLGRVLSRWRGRDFGFRSTVISIGADKGWLLWKFAALDLLPAPTPALFSATMPQSDNWKRKCPALECPPRTKKKNRKMSSPT
jgi:hypothetical protein